MEEKRILFLAHDSLAYGANQSLINIISFLEMRGIYTMVIFPRRGIVCDIFDNNGWNYNIINYRNELCPKYDGLKSVLKIFISFCYKKYLNFSASVRISSLIREKRINIIHSNSSVISLGFSIATNLQIKHVWHLREFVHPNYGLYVFSGLKNYKRKIRKAYNLLSVSSKVAEEFGVGSTTSVLYDAVRKEPKFLEPQSKEKYFIFCGSLHKNKGIEEAIHAMKYVASSNPDYLLQIVGEGTTEYEEYLRNLVESLELVDNVIFLGFRSDIDDLMSKASAFLMCSRNEALGRVTIESMLNFCLVIGYDDGGTSEIIEDSKTGLLYGNIETLISLMQSVIDDINQFDEIVKNAYRYSKTNFLEDSFGKKLLKYYDTLK